MQVFQNKFISICFGDAQESISLDEIYQQQYTQSLQQIAKKLKAIQTVFLRQEHGTNGMLVEVTDTKSYNFTPMGDYIATKKVQCGIGVVTADCLSVVLYDPMHHASVVVHAGWKGLQAGVFQAAVKKMINSFNSLPQSLEIYIGPAARPCCYEVQQDFVDAFKEHENKQIFFTKKDSKIYFDSRVFLIVLARSLGIDEEKIYTRYNVCTICNLSFCSYRREKENARRQITMVCLH